MSLFRNIAIFLTLVSFMPIVSSANDNWGGESSSDYEDRTLASTQDDEGLGNSADSIDDGLGDGAIDLEPKIKKKKKKKKWKKRKHKKHKKKKLKK